MREHREILKPKIQLTGFPSDAEEKKIITKKITNLGGRCLDDNYFDPKCNLVVSAKVCRTNKFLGACASGKYVVTPRYIEDCHKEGKWIKIENLAPSSSDLESDMVSNSYVFNASVRCHNKIKEQQSKGFFKKWKVGLLLKDLSRKLFFKRILIHGEASIVPVGMPLLGISNIPSVTHVFCDDEVSENVKILAEMGVPCLTTDFIVLSLTSSVELNVKSFSIFARMSSFQPMSSNSFKSPEFSPKYSPSSEEENKPQKFDGVENPKKRKLDEKCNSLKRDPSFKNVRLMPLQGNLANVEAKHIHGSPKVESTSNENEFPKRKNRAWVKKFKSKDFKNGDLNDKWKVSNSNSSSDVQINFPVIDLTSDVSISKDSGAIADIETLSSNPSECTKTSSKISTQRIFKAEEKDDGVEILMLRSPKKLENSKPKFKSPKNAIADVETLSSNPSKCAKTSSKISTQQIFKVEEKDDGVQILTLRSPKKFENSKPKFKSPKKQTKLFSQSTSRDTSQRSMTDILKPYVVKLESMNQKSSVALESIKCDLMHCEKSTDVKNSTTSMDSCSKESVAISNNFLMSENFTALFLANFNENYYIPALDFISSIVSFQQYPPAKCLNIIMFKILLNSDDRNIMLKVNELLYKVLSLHPPESTAMQNYYVTASHFHLNGIQSLFDVFTGLIRDCMDMYADVAKKLKCSAHILLNFMVEFIQVDFNFMKNDIGIAKENPIIAKIFWAKKTPDYINSNCRSYFDLISKCINMQDKTSLNYPLLQQLLIAHSRILNIMFELSKIKSSDFSMPTDLITAFCFSLNDNVKNFEKVRNVIRIIQPPQLVERLLECMCSKYNNTLSVSANAPLSFEKIVNHYTHLVPKVIDEKNIDQPLDDVNPTSIAEKNNVNDQAFHLTEIKKVNRRNCQGETRLIVACIKNKIVKVKKLLKNPYIDVNVQDNAGWSALHETCNHGNVECLEELLKFSPQKIGSHIGKSLDLTLKCSKMGLTPLHDGVLNNNIDCCRILLKYGGKRLTTILDKDGKLPIDYAQTNEMKLVLSSCQDLSLEQAKTSDPVSTIDYNMYRQFISKSEIMEMAFFYSNLVKSLLNSRDKVCKDEMKFVKSFPCSILKFKMHLKLMKNFDDEDGVLEKLIFNILMQFSFWKEAVLKN